MKFWFNSKMRVRPIYCLKDSVVIEVIFGLPKVLCFTNDLSKEKLNSQYLVGTNKLGYLQFINKL